MDEQHQSGVWLPASGGSGVHGAAILTVLAHHFTVCRHFIWTRPVFNHPQLQSGEQMEILATDFRRGFARGFGLFFR